MNKTFNYGELELRLAGREKQEAIDIYTRLATRYNIPRELAKAVLFGILYSDKDYNEQELEEYLKRTLSSAG